MSLRVHFKDATCLKYRREIITSWDRLLGNQILRNLNISVERFDSSPFCFASFMRRHRSTLRWRFDYRRYRFDLLLHVAIVSRHHGPTFGFR